MATFPRSRGSRSVTSPPKRSLILTGLEQVPFRSANPDQLHEVTMDNQPEVFSPTASPRGAIISPVRARTIKEYDQQIADLRKENFNLKLKLYFLEEKMEKKFDGDSKELHRVNIKLQVDVATLHKELEQKHKLLQDALGTLEKLEYNHRKEMEELKKKTNDRKTQLQGEITVFEQELQFNSKPRERESDVEDHCSEAYKQAFGLDLNHTCPLNDVPNDSSDMEKRRLKQLVNELKAIISKKDEEMEMSNQKFSKDEEKIKFLEIKIQKRENLVQDLTQTISKKDKEIQQLNKILEDRHGAIESIDGAFTTALYKATVAVSNGNKIGIVEAREELKAALKRVLFTSSEEVTDTLRGISSFSKEDLLDEVQRLRNELQSKENNIQILEQQSAERSQQVQNLQCSLNSLQEEISKSAKLHSNLYVERNIKVAQLQHPIQDTHGEMEELVGERDSTSEEMEKSFKRIINNLHLKDSTIRELEQRLKNAFEHKNEEIQRLKRELISSNEAIKSHKEENEALNLQIFQLKEERNHFEMDLKLKNEQFIELTIKIENLAEQLKVSEHKKSELDRFLKEKEKCFQEIVNSLNETHKELNDKKMMLEQLQGKFKFTSNEMELYKNHVNLLQYSLSKTEHNLRIRNEELALAFENIEMLKAQKKTSFINEVVCLTEPLRHVEECEMKVIKKQDDKEVIDLENTKNELNEKHVALTVQELNNKPTELSALTNYHCYLQDCLEDMKQSLAEKTDLIGIANRKIEELNREIEHLSVKLQKEGEKKGQLIIDENSIILCPSQLKEKMISTSDVSSRVIGSHETSCQQVEDINKEVNLIENAVLDKNSCICKLHSALNAKKEEVVFANKQIESLSEHLNCVKVELVKRNKELDKIFSEFTEQKKGKDKMNMNDSLLKEGKQRNIHQEKVVGFSNTITSDFPHLTSGNHVLQDKLKQCTQQQTILQNQITRWKDELLWLKSVKSQNEARSDLVETVLSQAQSEPSHKNESQTDDKCLGSTTSPFFHVQEQKEHETLSSELYVESSQVYRLKDLLSQAHLQIQSLHVQLENSKSQVRKQTSLALYYESQLKKAEIFSISRSEGDITKVTDHKDFVGILLLPETNKVLLNHSVSQPNINLAVQPNSRKNERSKSLLSTSASCKLPNDKVSESYYLWRQLQSHNLSKFGHSDNVCNLKKEVFVLVLRVEQLEKKAQKKLENFNNASVQVDEEEKLQNQLFYSQRVCELLQFQLEELTNLLERLLSHDANGQPSPRLWTPECISRVRQFLSESRKLSNCLSHSLLENNIIHSGIHNCALEIQPDLSTFPDLKLNTYSTKQVTSLETEKQQLQEDVKSKILEGRALDRPGNDSTNEIFSSMSSLYQNWSTQSGRRYTHLRSSVSDNQTARVDGRKESQGGQVVILEESDSDDILLLLNDRGLPQNVLIRNSQDKDLTTCSLPARSLSHQHRDGITDFWYRQSEQLENSKSWHMIDDLQKIQETGNALWVSYPSSDSDIWSEPDRNISLQRMGVDQEFGSYYSLVAYQQYRKKQQPAGEEYSSDESSTSTEMTRRPTVNSAHKPRKKKAHAGFQKIKSHLQNIEGLSEILHNDLSVLQELSGQVMAKVSELGSPEEKFKTKEVISRELMEEHHQYLKILQEKLDKVITSNENLTEKLKGKLDFRHVGPHGSMQKNVRDLDTKYKIAIERVNKYKQELVAKTSMERELQDTLSQYKIDAIHKEQELASCQKELTSCRSLLQEMEREIKEKEVAYTKLMDEKDQLEKEMSSRGHLHQQVHMRLQHLVENITDLRSRLLEKDQQSKHSEDMRAVMENELEARQKECKQVQNWNLRLQKEIKEKEVQCKDLEKKNEKLEKQNLTLETLVQQTGKHLNELEEKYKRSTEKEQKYVCLEKEMIRKDMDMRDLINRNENLHTQLILKEKQVDCLEEDKSLLNFKILELQEQSHTSNETIFQLRAELISSQEKTDKTCSELEQKLQNSQIYSETKASEAEKQHLISQHQLTEMYRKCTWLEEQLWSRDDRVQKLTEKASWLECEIQLKQKELEISTEKCFKLEKGLKDETEQFETRRKDLEQQIKIKEQEVIELAETEQDLKLKLKLRDEELKKLNDRNIELQETIHERELQFTEAVSEKSELEIKVNNLEEEMKHLKQSRSKPDGKDDFSGIRLAEFLKDKSRLEEELNTTQQRLEEVTQLNKCLQLELKAADKLGVQKEDLASVEDQAEETNKTLLLELVEELQPLRIALTKSTDFNRRLHRDIKQCTSRKEGINSSTQGLGSEQSISPASTLSLASTGSYTHTTNTQSESLEPSSPESSLSSAGDKNPYFHLSGFREPINHPTHWTFKNGSENKTHTDMGASSIRKELHGDHLLNSPTTTDASSSEGSLQHHISTYDAENNELCEKPFIRQCSVSSGDYETLSLTVLPKDILDHYPIKQTKSLESSDGSCHQSSTEKEGFRHDSNGTELSVTGRPCNSSPDLGIESDPNHEGGDREEPVFTTWNKLAVAVSSKRSVTIQLVRKRKTNENSKINRTFAGEQLPLDTAGLSGHGFSASVPELGEGEPHATCRLKDYQLLKKEIRESLVLLRGVIAQNLEYNTLKDIYSSCSDVDRCLEKSWNIINCFQLASLPSKKAVRSFAVSSLNKENQKLQEELSEVKKQLEETTKKLAVVKREKDGMERAITRQLTKTCLVLQQAKGNLAGDGKSTKYPVGII
ncbi:centromere-associated protein E-like isoform X1 [Limulus polyphemus]|uniref:Centromere-associated protein E-like isoform X1 n=1 Tax=Limulus polyphemus TaxID=6850 RepID=A0ABM1BKG0_LIMPO|nr:centromere-associated protein E-like isoform X1 [Limulus polyphemus]